MDVAPIPSSSFPSPTIGLTDQSTSTTNRSQARSLQPVSGSERLPTIDLIRGLALLGILMMNIPSFGYLRSGLFTIVQDVGSRDFFAYAAVGTLFEGTMRALFSMLFGAGMLLFTANKRDLADGPSVVEFYYRRLLWLVLFGVIDAFLFLWRGDILYQYGLIGMLLYPFRRLKPIWLIGLVLFCMVVDMYGRGHYERQLREDREGYLEAVRLEKAHKKPSAKLLQLKAWWEEDLTYFKPNAKKDAKTLEAMRGNYPSVFAELLPQNSRNEGFSPYYGCWDILTMMFLGMALLSWGFFTNKLSTQTYATILLVGYGLGIPISWFYVQFDALFLRDPVQALDTYRVFPYILYDIRRILLALGHASLLLLIYRSQLVPWLIKALTAVGQMAFTNYLMQSILCTLFFHGYGLGYYGKLPYYQLYYVVVAVWIIQLIISPIWLRYFRFGPFEWLWRSLTYWQFQPMRRSVIEYSLAL